MWRSRVRVTRNGCAGVVLAGVLTTSACGVDKNSVLAPSGTVVTVTSDAALVPTSTAVPITVKLTSIDGAPVPNGTEVLFSASRGRLEQLKQRTQGGQARVSYVAPPDVGAAEIRASSSDAQGSLTLAVISGPVARISLAASRSELPAGGGETEITASVQGPAGQPVAGAPVTFQTSAGTMSSKAATTDQSGAARALLKTSAPAVVTAKIAGLAGGGEVAATIKVALRAGAPAPAPPPPSTPGLPPAPAPPQAGLPFSLDEVVWLHTDVSRWRQTSTITEVHIGDPPICIEHTKAGRWPVKAPDGVGVEANPWVFANVGGRWYAATYEWLKPGQTCKAISAGTIGAHTKRAPLTSWRPRSGELVGFMVSALARSGQDSVAERSNIVMVRWP